MAGHIADEKDRLGEKLRHVEAAREHQWARQRDAELLEKLQAKEKASPHCPHCGKPLIKKEGDGVEILACPDEEGAWLDAGALKTLLKVVK